MSEWLIISLCVVTGIVSLIAFNNKALIDRLLFRPDMIIAHKQWERLFSSALIHADWMHLGFNLFALYSFGSHIELYYGWKTLLVIYAFSVLGGSLLSLYLHRHHNYAALGASGGVCGVIFSAIFLIPGTGVSLFFIPIAIPGNIFALIYLVGTFWGLRKGKGNIGHDAHFGGAMVGLGFALAIAPQRCLSDPLYFWGSVLVSLICLAILYIDPLNASGQVIPTSLSKGQDSRVPTGDIRYDGMISHRQDQRETDRILEKISKHGYDSITPRERAILDRRAERNRKR